MECKCNILYETKPATINALRWTGKNQRDMFDFLTDYKKTDEYMSPTGDNFIIAHNEVRGGLCLRTIDRPADLAPVNIGDYVIKLGSEFVTMKAALFNRTYSPVQEEVYNG